MTEHGSNLVWGAASIAKEIGRDERSTYYLLENGLIPGTKAGAQWGGRARETPRSNLLASQEGGSVIGCDFRIARDPLQQRLQAGLERAICWLARSHHQLGDLDPQRKSTFDQSARATPLNSVSY
jgi:hypothetical protein